MKADALLFVGDPHVLASNPGHRIDDYRAAVMNKLAFCLEQARVRNATPVLLGDLFHVPRNNPNDLMVELIELFRPHKPYCLVGNHDKYEARFSEHTSLSLLAAAGAVRLIDRGGEVVSLTMGGERVLLGATPDADKLPRSVERGDHAQVVWICHHNLRFAGCKEGYQRLREIPGIDLVINGHLHAPRESERCGQTLWCNPGSIVRLTRSAYTRERVPACVLWRPGKPHELERLVVPHEPFDAVFEALPEGVEAGEGVDSGGSGFVAGLQHLQGRRTTDAAGLRAFLAENVERENVVDATIWELYEEVSRVE